MVKERCSAIWCDHSLLANEVEAAPEIVIASLRWLISEIKRTVTLDGSALPCEEGACMSHAR